MKIISINQFIKYGVSTERGKKTIIRNQISPNRFLIPWYQLAKARIKKYLQNPMDTTPIVSGMKELSLRVPSNNRQKSDFKISIEALQRVASMKLPKLLYGYQHEIIKTEKKELVINGLQININPELIVKAEIEGKIVYGGVKIYLSKTKPYSLSQSKYASTLLYYYLSENVAKKGEIVLPELCFSVDVLANRWISASNVDEGIYQHILNQCGEISVNWEKEAG